MKFGLLLAALLFSSTESSAPCTTCTTVCTSPSPCVQCQPVGTVQNFQAFGNVRAGIPFGAVSNVGNVGNIGAFGNFGNAANFGQIGQVGQIGLNRNIGAVMNPSVYTTQTFSPGTTTTFTANQLPANQLLLNNIANIRTGAAGITNNQRLVLQSLQPNVPANSAIVVGSENVAAGSGNMISGNKNAAYGLDLSILGSGNAAKGANSTIIGN